MKFKSTVTIFIVSSILTAILTWPFVLKLNTYFVDAFDYPIIASILWHNQISISTGKIFNQAQYFNTNAFFPLPLTLAYSDHLFPQSLIFSLIYWISHNLVLSDNLLSFLTFVLTFLSAFYVINKFVKNKYASILGASVFTYNPLAFTHFPDHLPFLSRYFLPFIFLYAFKFLKKPTLKNAVLFFFFFTLNALVSYYLFAFTAIILPFFAIPYLVQKLMQKDRKYFLNLVKYSLTIIVFLPILFYFYSPYLELSQKEGANWSLDTKISLSSKLVDWTLPAHDNLLYGTLIKALPWQIETKKNFEMVGYGEHALFLNVLPVILFILGLIYWYKKVDRKNAEITKIEIISFLIVLLLTALLSFGPILPFYPIANFLLPILNGIRAPIRFQFIFYFPFSIMVGYGALYLFKRVRQHSIFLFVFLIALFTLENFSTLNFDSTSNMLPKTESIKNNLTFLKDHGTLHYPTLTPTILNESGYLNWSFVTGEKMLNGLSGYIPVDWWIFLSKMRENLGEAEIKKLIAINIDYLIIHKNLLQQTSLTNYNKNLVLYQKGGVFENSEILIVDLHKYNFQISNCTLKDDFAIELKQVTITKDSFFWALILKNNKDCYLANTLMDRYMDVPLKDSERVRHLFRLVLPLVIGPNETAVLSELNGTLRVH